MHVNFLALAAFAASAVAEIPASEVVTNINAITSLSSKTNTIAVSITIVNAPQTAPQVANNFQTIITMAGNDNTAMGGLSGSKKAHYSAADQGDICKAFITFVHVHQRLLKTVIGKHSVLNGTPYTQPIAEALRTLEGGVDTVAFDIIATVPTCAAKAKRAKAKLDKYLKSAGTTYGNPSTDSDASNESMDSMKTDESMES